MRRKFEALSVIFLLSIFLVACSNRKGNTDSTSSVPEQTTTQNSKTTNNENSSFETNNASAGSENSNTEMSTSSDTLTGTVDRNKGFMITVIADNDSEAYVFQLNESQQNEYMDIKEGDKVTISYTNGLPSPDNLGTIVTDIQLNN